MEPVYYTVDSIDGDYAHMTSDSGIENQWRCSCCRRAPLWAAV